ncbi:MAG: elongation factor Ts [Candidatus Marinimicrobia bacterium]|jgi:elongation factor Ts|nr:elongation factor Ts [Candidatus Neomarinimicrobiota bacterium]|tara:strand:+ start:11054 stop:11677 length:624 start_codon:yes stop_codon:yes gene_type:complete
MISAKSVKELRDATGAGMMDCKKALSETNGDVNKALEHLRKAGIAKAEKKSGRSTKEGLIDFYIHQGGKLGVLVEVNCETDFVARTEQFQNFTKDIAMHIAASNPISVKREDIPSDIIEKEKEIFAELTRKEGKPENIIDKIVKGRLDKFFSENSLLEQTYVKDPDKTVQDILTDIIAKLGENISIQRFKRFQLGETIQVSEEETSD